MSSNQNQRFGDLQNRAFARIRLKDALLVGSERHYFVSRETEVSRVRGGRGGRGKGGRGRRGGGLQVVGVALRGRQGLVLLLSHHLVNLQEETGSEWKTSNRF